ncbi:MAG: ribonuclease H-like domain-containing protein [Limnochordaceae bacterium]|nr:ribonuclease H-like domain-containing protein [Limnochordaceae bacterium]
MTPMHDQRALRRRRAQEENLTAQLIGGAPFAGRYRVTGKSGRVHEVKFRQARGAVCRCDCQDFETNGLGTCKHIEAVRLALEARFSPAELSEHAGKASRPSWEGRRVDDAVTFFDLETQRLFQEVGGRHHLDRLGLAAAVTYCEGDGGFRHYFEDDAAALIDRLLGASLVVGFNVLRFDYEVLAGYSKDADLLYTVPTLDLMFELEQVLDWRPSLDSVARATLGTTKTASGLQAVEWYREGRIEEIVEYCEEDVSLTRALFHHGLREGRLSVLDREGAVIEVPAPWSHGLLAA